MAVAYIVTYDIPNWLVAMIIGAAILGVLAECWCNRKK